MSDKRVYLALILGASEFPYTSLKPNPAFRNSAEAMASYLEALKGGPDPYRVVSLFDSELKLADQVDAIEEALQGNRDATDLIVYYVGHGGFLRGGREFFLTLRTTKERNEDVTALRASTLANRVNRKFANRRVFVMLDCCFAGEAVHEFQSNTLGEVVEAVTFRRFPARGTALLCAASRDEPAISPTEGRYTVFSECLLDVLQQGIRAAGPFLTLDAVAEGLLDLVDRRYGGDVSLPELHSPRQPEGDIARQRLFPNLAYTAPAQSQRQEVDRTRTGPAEGPVARRPTPTRESPRESYRRGEKHGLAGRYEEALGDFDRVLELQPNDANALRVRGATYQMLGRHEEALKDFNRALELEPDNASALADWGATYRVMGRDEEALKDFNRVLELDPDWEPDMADLDRFVKKAFSRRRRGFYESRLRAGGPGGNLPRDGEA